MALRYKHIRFLRTALSIILCICIIGSVTVQSMYCAPFVIPLSSLVPIVAKILITAGVTFLTLDGMLGITNECIEGMTEEIANELRSMVNSITDSAILVSDNVWNYCKGFVDSQINAGDTSEYTWVTKPYSANTIYPRASIANLVVNGVAGEYAWVQGTSDVRCYVNGSVIVDPATVSLTSWSDIATFKILTNSTGLYWQFLRADGSTKMIRYPSANTFYTDVIFRSVEVYESISITVNPDIVDNPDYIHGNDVTGENSFLINQTYADLLTTTPEAITDADITAAVTTYEDLTCDDVKAETVPDNLAGGADTSILQGILDSLTGTITDKITAINNAITGTIAGLLTDIRSNTHEEELESNNIFDFFISLLMILKHLVLIVLKFLLLVVVIKDIPAQSSLFNANTKAVIDYIHDHNLPVFNVSFMQMINAFIGILVAVSVIRIINKNVRANL